MISERIVYQGNRFGKRAAACVEAIDRLMEGQTIGWGSPKGYFELSAKKIEEPKATNKKIWFDQAEQLWRNIDHFEEPI